MRDRPEGRYRKISLRMHADAAYRRLSDPQPCGKALWHHLLFGPHTGIIPGLSVAGEAQLAETLNWPIEGFRKAFREVSGEDLAKADWKARVVWLPNAIRHNPPQSPNVVRGWAEAWREVPECELKSVAHQALKGFVCAMGEGYAKAFLEAFPEDMPESGAGAGTRAGLPPPVPPSVAAPPLPIELDTPEFREAWNAWETDRRKRRLKPLTDRGKAQQFAALAPLGPAKACACIAESIRQGWQGLFPERMNGNGHKPREDREVRRLREMLAPGEAAEAKPLDVPARLAALAAAIPAKLVGAKELRRRVLALESADSVSAEAALGELDAQLLALAEEAMPPDLEAEIAAGIAACERGQLARATPEAKAGARKSLRARLLRERLGVPVLSLFGPDAQAREAAH